MPGMPVWLSNIDMRALFDYNNLTGISGTGNSAQIDQYKVKNIKLIWEKDANTKYAFDDGSNKPKELQKEYPNTIDH